MYEKDDPPVTVYLVFAKSAAGSLPLSYLTKTFKSFSPSNVTTGFLTAVYLSEVFTPLSVVEEILHKLPKKIWKDHSLKWLDPATGIGNFPIMIYFRLMDGLKKWQPNEEKRIMIISRFYF